KRDDVDYDGLRRSVPGDPRPAARRLASRRSQRANCRTRSGDPRRDSRTRRCIDPKSRLGALVIVIRWARAVDRATVEVLLASARLPLDGIADHFAGFILAEDAGEIVGVAGLEVYQEYGLLRSVLVSPRASNRGIGRQLTGRILRE